MTSCGVAAHRDVWVRITQIDCPLGFNYSATMALHRATVLSLTIRCLLFSWLCFGGLELLEQLNVMQEVEDQDEVALAQVGSGLKSEVTGPDDTVSAPVANQAAESIAWLSFATTHQFVRLMVHSPPSLRLHQQLSVYRI